MLFYKILLASVAAALMWSPAKAGTLSDPADFDQVPLMQDVTARASAAVPTVPLPPGLAGALASVGLIVGLRFSRHRRWITLR